MIGSALIIERIIDEIDPEPFLDLRDLPRMLFEKKSDPEDGRLSSSYRLEAFRSRLAIQSDPSTSVITIPYRSKDPEVAASVVNRLVQAFLEHRADNRQHAIQQASRQIQRVTEMFPAAIEGLETPSAAPHSARGASPVEQRYSRPSEELTDATLEFANARARLAEADFTTAQVSPTEEGGRIVEKLRSEAHAAEARFDDLQTRVQDIEVEISDAKMLLIEGDMRTVGLATKLSTVSPENGLVDLLSGKVDRVEDVIVKETESGADLLLASGPSEDAFALSRSALLKALIADVRARYDLIIVDCPPVLGVSDTLMLCDETDEILFVIRWQETHRAAAGSAIRELEPRPIAGVVLTQVDLADHLKYATAGKYR